MIVGFTTSPAGEATGALMTLAAKRMVLVRRVRAEGTGKCMLQVLNKLDGERLVKWLEDDAVRTWKWRKVGVRFVSKPGFVK